MILAIYTDYFHTNISWLVFLNVRTDCSGSCLFSLLLWLSLKFFFVLVFILWLGLMFMFELAVLPLCWATGAKACIDCVACLCASETVHSYWATEVGTRAGAVWTHVDKDGLCSLEVLRTTSKNAWIHKVCGRAEEYSGPYLIAENRVRSRATLYGNDGQYCGTGML